MSQNLSQILRCLGLLLLFGVSANAQITQKQRYKNNKSAVIGTFQGISFRESGFSGLYPIPNTNGTEFWTVSDRGVNVDAANSRNLSCVAGGYDKIYGFPNYAPKIHRIRIKGDSIQILQTIAMKRPNGTNATGLLNPVGLGSTALEIAYTDTVTVCANTTLTSKMVTKDVWGIDSEGIVVDGMGNFWICEEGGPTVWKLNSNGVVINRYTPYGNLSNKEPQDIAVDTVFKYRRNNRGFEGIALTPNGKIYAIIQSPIQYPASASTDSRVHRILEIDPKTNATRMFAYLNDSTQGASGGNQIRMRDWKVGDMAAVNDSVFLVLEAALRGTSDFRRLYAININQATPVSNGLVYGGKSLEELKFNISLAGFNIKPVKKTLVMDLNASGWPSELEKAEGLAIIDARTIAICNDNDYGQSSSAENGVASATTVVSNLFTYDLGSSSLSGFKFAAQPISQGVTASTSSANPYLLTTVPGAKFTAMLTAGDKVGNYTMAGTPDGVGAYDNGNGTFTMLVNHEFGNTAGAVRAHGAKGAFVSKWTINKSDLSVVSGSDLIQNVYLWTGTGYALYNAANTTAGLAFGRFCSADLPEVSAYYNSVTGLGTMERIFMNGEEFGAEGRGFGHIVTGTLAGTSFELPRTGKFSWENAVANPYRSNKTIVVGTDDATPGQVYVYIGSKTNMGNDVEKAGLTNGKLYGIAVSGLLTETNSTTGVSTAFTMVDLGDVTTMTGAALETASSNAGVTKFLRPEDAAWDPSKLNDLYFATTNSFTSPSRLWRARFTDIANPELGGTIEAVLDGTEGQKMLDNITIDKFGHVLMVEDVGGNAHLGRLLQYDIPSDKLTVLGEHDPNRFSTLAGSNLLTIDEEASGILDVQDILGAGMFLIVDQAHYALPGEVVEGGQLLAFFNPATYNGRTPSITFNGFAMTITSDGVNILGSNTVDLASIFQTNSMGAKSFAITSSLATSIVGSNVASLSGSNLKALNAGNVTILGTVGSATGFASGSASITVNVVVITEVVDGIEVKRFVLYPNPVSNGVVNFSTEITGKIYNINGVLVKSFEEASQVNVSGLTKGLYLIRTSDRQTKSFIIE
jgi:hypothetical protein